MSLSRRRSAFLSTILIIDMRLYTFALSRCFYVAPINVIFIGQFINFTTHRRFVRFFLELAVIKKLNESIITYSRFNNRAGTANRLKVTVLNDIKIAFDFTIRKLNERVE